MVPLLVVFHYLPATFVLYLSVISKQDYQRTYLDNAAIIFSGPHYVNYILTLSVRSSQTFMNPYLRRFLIIGGIDKGK